MAVMSDDEIAFYLTLPQPIGGPRYSVEDLQRQKWYYALFKDDIERLVAGTMIAQKEGEDPEVTRADSIKVQEFALGEIEKILREYEQRGFGNL